MTERIELTNQEKIRTLGEKETYRYLGIFEADIIKQAKMKEIKKKKNTSKEGANNLKPNNMSEISSKR